MSHRLRVAVGLGCGGAVLVAAPLSPAAAQLLEDPSTVVVPPAPRLDVEKSVFARDNNVPIRERAVPEFTAQGIPVGRFRLYPGLAVGPFVTSNVYADDGNRKSDVAFVVRPEAVLRTEAGRLDASLYARGDVRRYLHNSSENTEEGLAGAQARLDTGNFSSVAIGAQYGSFIEPRSAADSPPNAAKPLEYTGLSAYARGELEGANTRLVVATDLTRLRFRDTPLRGGGTLRTQDRDRGRYQGSVRLERALSPALSIYASGSVNRIDYRLAPASTGDRDSWGWGAFIGTSFEVTRTVIADARVGYVRQKFDLANVKPIKGLGARADVSIFPNRLWDFRLHAESSVQDTGVPGSRGVFRRGGSLGANFELRRYLILGAQAEYYRDRYRGNQRTDHDYAAEASATYLSRNHWNAALRYRLQARNCICTDMVNDFHDHRLTATLTLQY